MLPEAGTACYCGKMATSMGGAGTRTWNAVPLLAGFPGRQVLAATKEAPHARGRPLWTAAPPRLPHLAPEGSLHLQTARFKMTQQEGAAGGNNMVEAAQQVEIIDQGSRHREAYWYCFLSTLDALKYHIGMLLPQRGPLS